MISSISAEIALPRHAGQLRNMVGLALLCLAQAVAHAEPLNRPPTTLSEVVFAGDENFTGGESAVWSQEKTEKAVVQATYVLGRAAQAMKTAESSGDREFFSGAGTEYAARTWFVQAAEVVGPAFRIQESVRNPWIGQHLSCASASKMLANWYNHHRSVLLTGQPERGTEGIPADVLRRRFERDLEQCRKGAS